MMPETPSSARVLLPSQSAPKWNVRMIAVGYTILLFGFVVLSVPAGYTQSGCPGPYIGCPIVSNPYISVIAFSCILATIPWLSIFDFRRVFRFGSAAALGGMLVLLLGTLLVWKPTQPYGYYTIVVSLSTTPWWSPLLKLGATLIGSGLMIFGYLVPLEGRSPGRRSLTTDATAPHQA